MDTTVPGIRFDANGVCQYCHMHDRMEELYPLDPKAREERLGRLVDTIRKKGKGKRYDCVCGTSGGRDSTWVLYTVKQLGLRPLAVHFDNGWNSATAVSNVENATTKLNIDLETVVADWDEFRSLQVAFLEASTPDVEVPTDVAIHSVLHRIAAQEGVNFVLNGHSFRTEGISPLGWTYMDGRYIESVYRIFNGGRLRDFKNFKLWDVFRFQFLEPVSVVPILNYSEYNHDVVGKILENECGWKYYGGHHHESTYTAFIQSYLLPQKFQVDKRKTENSALVRSGQMTREDALHEVESSQYAYDITLLPYILNKLDISQERWDRIFNAPRKSFRDYPSYYPFIRAMGGAVKLAAKAGVIPELLYLKFLG